MENSDLYKSLGIKHDTKWLKHVVNKENDIQNMSSIVNEHDVFPSTSKDIYSNASEMNTEEVVCDEIDEDDERFAAVNRDTMIDDADPHPKELIFVHGEGKNFISLFTNKDIEYLAFSTIFCDERCKTVDVTVHYSAICKYKLRSVDRRVAKMCQTCSSSWRRYT